MGDQQLMFDPLTKRELEILNLMAEGLSNHEIAHKLALTHGTVKWYTGQIYSKLGVNSRTQAIARLDKVRPSDPQTSSAAMTNRLPMPLTGFVGRQRELKEIKELLATNRLVTLTGPGGSGKTRLALEVAHRIHHAFADGAAFVDLSLVTQTTTVPNAIAHALNIVEHPDTPLPETLKHALSTQEKLIVIDNFEHVLSAAPLLTDLMMAVPHLTLFVTSREALRLSGEQEYPVPPLSLPETTLITSEHLAESEATTLFLQHVRSVQPHFRITDENAQAIAAICQRLDGLPLAIELAAARCKLLSPQALLTRLSSRLDSLIGGPRNLHTRQQTLRNTINWSFELLDKNEQTLFARLAVFRGGRSLEAIEAVCADGLADDVFNMLTSLLDKSLIYRKDSATDEPRFWMLETIHEYAWEKLKTSGETEFMHQQHAEYFVQLAERAEPELRLVNQYRWGMLLESEHDNFRAVLEWSLTGNVTLGVRLAGALHLFWFHYGYHAEGINWTRRLLDHLNFVPRRYHAKFLNCAGWMAGLGDIDHLSGPLFQRALEAARNTQDTPQFAWALAYLGYSMMDDPDKSIPLVEEGLALFRQLDDKPGIAGALNIIGEIARFNGDYHRARIVYEESFAIGQEVGDLRRIYVATSNLAFVAMHEGNYAHAIGLNQEMLRLYLGMNNRNDLACVLHHLCIILALAGQSDRAARLFGTSEVSLKHLGAFFDPADQPEIESGIAAMRAQLGEEAFEAALAEGRKMTLEQAVADALDEIE